MNDAIGKNTPLAFAGAIIADDGGMVIGSPTGDSMGPGTLNVEALYVNGVPVP